MVLRKIIGTLRNDRGMFDMISAYVSRIRTVDSVDTVEYSVLEPTEQAIA